MQNARYIHGLPSRSGHRKVPKVIALDVVRDGETFTEEFDTEETPALLSFPIFGLPRYVAPETEDLRMRLEGVITASFGKDPEEFLKRTGATTVFFPEGKTSPVQFARMVAKIAYGSAWLTNVLERVGDTSALVESFLNRPDTLGKFVGTLPPPYVSYSDVLHRFVAKSNDQELIYAEIQLFAEIGAPTYIVVLGRAR